MRYMNGYDIDNAARRFADHRVLSDAVQTLKDLKAWTDSNSDGWAYWPKPARAAAQLMELIDGNGTYDGLRADHEHHNAGHAGQGIAANQGIPD